MLPEGGRASRGGSAPAEEAMAVSVVLQRLATCTVRGDPLRAPPSGRAKYQPQAPWTRIISGQIKSHRLPNPCSTVCTPRTTLSPTYSPRLQPLHLELYTMQRGVLLFSLLLAASWAVDANEQQSEWQGRANAKAKSAEMATLFENEVNERVLMHARARALPNCPT